MSDSDPALRFTFVIQVGTQYLDPARECPILEKRKMKLCGVGLPKVKWWEKKQNQKKTPRSPHPIQRAVS